MKHAWIFRTVAVFALFFSSSCGDKKGDLTQLDQNNGNHTDTATQSLILPTDHVHLSQGGVTTWNNVNGPNGFQGMRNLVRAFEIDPRFSGILTIGNVFENYSNCTQPGPGRITWNVRFYLFENGIERPIPNSFRIRTDGGARKLLIAKLEDVDCFTAGFRFTVTRY